MHLNLLSVQWYFKGCGQKGHYGPNCQQYEKGTTLH